MNANEVNLLTLLDGTKQFILPIYQRRYSWERKHCQQLWDDIMNVGDNEAFSYHFFGSVISREEGIAAKPQFFVIDGQQRLTTVSLLLSALGRAIEDNNAEIGTNRETIEDSYLFHPHQDGDWYYKLLLTKPDKNTLIQLLKDEENSDYGSLLVKNYHFFKRKLEPDNLETIYKGIQKLMIVNIVLKSDAGNPQLIFESLNSKGVQLSQADLIRNYVLMGQERDFQNKLYDTYWYPMEENFGTQTKRFNLFIRDYLTLKTGKIPGKNKVYEFFKKEYMPDIKQPQELKEIIDETERYSQHYVRIALRSETDPDFCACLEDLYTLDVEVSYPILLRIYEGYTQEQIEKAEVIEIFRLIKSYVLRRVICNLSTSSMGKNFAYIASTANSMFALPASTANNEHFIYLKVLKTLFSKLDGVHRFPRDDEFKRGFLTREVYGLFRTRSYLLGKLENDGRKEPIHVKNYTIERVMPDKLTEEWEVELGENWGEDRERFLGTIGNLTLTEHNSELSNRSFKEKRDHKPGGYRDSSLYLNQSFAKAERWNADAIIERAKMLSEKACKIWSYPLDNE